MRLIAISVLSIFVVLPGFASARLPVVNVAAGGVSARAAFGDASASAQKQSVKSLYGTVPESAPTVAVAPAPRQVVARTPQAAAAAQKNIDHGAQIARSDVLTPRRPSSDLWARNDNAPLRVPSPQEFAVLRSDAVLPEESLDYQPRHIARNADVAPTITNRHVAPAAEPLAEIDNQIARLTELQRRADISINSVPVSDTEPVTNNAPDTRVASANRVVAQRAVVGHVPDVRTEKAEAPAPVKLSRLVVPMDNDVVTRDVAIKKNESSRIASVRDDMTKLSPTELRQAFRKTFLSENKHLSTYSMDDRFDVVSDMSSGIEGFTARRDLSEAGGIRPLEIKIKFRNEDSSLSRDNYNLLNEYAGVVLNNPMRAIQVAIPQSATVKSDDRKLAARRLAIVEQVLRDAGIAEQRIMPVLAQRNDDSFVLRIISSDQYETMTQQQKNLFGDTVKKKSYKSMSW